MKQTSILFFQVSLILLTCALKLSFFFVVDKVLQFIKDKKTHDNNNQSKLCQQLRLILCIQPDVLGEGYEQLKLSFPDDYEEVLYVQPSCAKPCKILKKRCCISTALLTTFSKPKWLNNLISMVIIFMRSI